MSSTSTLPLIITSLLATFPLAASRGFLPTAANGYGYLVPAPAGGLGCGLNYVACFPEVSRTLSRWGGMLRATYDSPLAYEPAHGVEVRNGFIVRTRGDVFADVTQHFVPTGVVGESVESLSDAAMALREHVVDGLTPGAVRRCRLTSG